MIDEPDHHLTLVPSLAAQTQLLINGVQLVVDRLYGNLAHYILVVIILKNAQNFKRSNTIHKKAVNP